MSYLHEKNVIHADLKSDNILLRNNSAAVVSDFGLSKTIESLNRHHIDSDRGKLPISYYQLKMKLEVFQVHSFQRIKLRYFTDVSTISLR